MQSVSSALTILTAILAIFAIPLSTLLIAPRFAFRGYVSELHLKHSDAHVEASSASIRHSILAAICLAQPFLAVRTICPISIDVDYTLDDLILAQRVLYGELSLHSPAPNASSIFLAIADAADMALVLDDLILLAEDGWLGVQGIGDASLLVEVGKASRVASMSVYQLLIHMELTIARISFIHRSILVSLDMLAYLDARVCRLGGLSAGALHHVVLVSQEATLDSVQRLRSEVQRTISYTLKVLELLDKFARRGDMREQCAKLRRVDMCSQLDPLTNAAPALAPIVSELLVLKDILQEGVDGYVLAKGEGSAGTKERLLEVSAARKSTAAALGLSRYIG
ncbi:hypothetical protein C8T65DRAFT_747089 [Cerioporus squamosus]|nr:hypothetical protein C8T65DRAFT_747089 [Cerioporus squamosus]